MNNSYQNSTAIFARAAKKFPPPLIPRHRLEGSAAPPSSSAAKAPTSSTPTATASSTMSARTARRFWATPSGNHQNIGDGATEPPCPVDAVVASERRRVAPADQSIRRTKCRLCLAHIRLIWEWSGWAVTILDCEDHDSGRCAACPRGAWGAQKGNGH
jgi:hypothetical protein